MTVRMYLFPLGVLGNGPTISVVTQSSGPPTANLWDSLVLIDNIVYKKFVKKDDSEECLQLLTPTCLKNEILTVAHNAILSGHFGRKKTLQRIRREFYWFEMREDVEIWIQRCDVCAQSKVTNRKPKAPLGSIPVGGPLDCVTTDIVGQLPFSMTTLPRCP
jgi:hypothetical protein